MPTNHHALDTGGDAAVTIEGSPCFERFQANLYGKFRLGEDQPGEICRGADRESRQDQEGN